MNKLNYLEAKTLTIESYNEFIDDEGFSPEQAIAATLEDSILMMKKNNKVLIAVIQTLAIISLKQHFIPDYLLTRLPSLGVLPDLANYEEPVYEQDKKQLSLLLQGQKYTIDQDDSYSQRVNMLLS